MIDMHWPINHAVTADDVQMGCEDIHSVSESDEESINTEVNLS